MFLHDLRLALARFRSRPGHFGVVCLILALGIGALLYHQAQSRSREFGGRLALGARPRSVVGLVLARGSRLSTIGAALGLLGSFYLAPLVETFLFEVRPQDPWTFAGVAVTLGATSLLAAAIPAWRAGRTDPMSVLRSE